MSKNSEKTILVVDDDLSILTVLERALIRDGYNVLTADDGKSALDILERNVVNLVITDVHMPHLSGTDLLAEINQSFGSVPVILITGKPTVDLAVECMKIGARDYISKPFSISKIEATIERVLNSVKTISPPTINVATTRIREKPNILPGYSLIDRIGEGNMGVVYLVEREEDGKAYQYALKLFKPVDFTEEQLAKAKQRFLQEAEAASKITHPNVVAIEEYGMDETENIHYILMEYIEGLSLKHYLAKANTLNYLQKAKIISQIAEGLIPIHELDICHRDIKPANVLIDDALHVKITDFGIAKLPDSMLTQTNDVMGSPSYMSPESFVSSKIDHRADIFSLGVMAYELFLGRRPFEALGFLRLCYIIRHEDPAKPTTIDKDFPEELQIILEKMLQKKPDDRYSEVREISVALNNFISVAEGSS